MDTPTEPSTGTTHEASKADLLHNLTMIEQCASQARLAICQADHLKAMVPGEEIKLVGDSGIVLPNGEAAMTKEQQKQSILQQCHASQDMARRSILGTVKAAMQLAHGTGIAITGPWVDVVDDAREVVSARDDHPSGKEITFSELDRRIGFLRESIERHDKQTLAGSQQE